MANEQKSGPNFIKKIMPTVFIVGMIANAAVGLRQVGQTSAILVQLNALTVQLNALTVGKDVLAKFVNVALPGTDKIAK